MKISIETVKLQELVAKSIKGVGNNKLLPITCLMGIDIKDSVLTLMSTDGSNHLRVNTKLQNQVEGSFHAVVNADLFSKLIAKVTSDEVSLELLDSSLEVKGNGTYNLELPQNEDGGNTRFIDYLFEGGEGTVVNTATLQKSLTISKPAVAQTFVRPYLTGYYISNKVIATDGLKVCSVENELLSSPMLISAETAELLQLMTEENIVIERNGEKILFSTPSVILFTYQLEDIESYPVEAISQFVGLEFSRSVKLPKQLLLGVLDRLLLFVTEYDKNGVYLTFTENGMTLHSKKSNAKEMIPYLEPVENLMVTQILVDIEMLRAQLQANTTDVANLWYGDERCIKMTFENTTQIVSLLTDES